VGCDSPALKGRAKFTGRFATDEKQHVK